MPDWNMFTDIPNLEGKVAVVTGASTGVGLQIVRQLAKHGAKVFATTRHVGSTGQAKKALSSDPSISSTAVEWLQMDLADLRSVTTESEELRRRTSRLDILVSNAATITAVKETVTYGWEKNMAVNVVGSLLFIHRVSPLLVSTSKIPGADVRIITMASTAPQVFLPADFQFNFDSATGLSSPMQAYPSLWRYATRFLFSSDMILYSISKAGAMIVASKVQQVFESHGIDILSLIVHPGEVYTEGVTAANGVLLRTVARMAFMTSEQGAASPLFAATASQVRADPDQYKYKLLLPVGKATSLPPVVSNKEQADGLWNLVNKELERALSDERLTLLSPYIVQTP